MTTVRNPAFLVQQIKELVPKENEFYDKLDWYINDFSYKPPEMSTICIYRFSEEVIEPMIGPPPIIEDWKIKVISIWMDETEEEIRRKYKN